MTVENENVETSSDAAQTGESTKKSKLPQLHSLPYLGNYFHGPNNAQQNGGNVQQETTTTSGSSDVDTSNPNSPPGSPKLLHTSKSLANFNKREYRPLIERMTKQIESNEPFYSLEFFPPRTPNGVANLLARLERMGEGAPLFVDVTWHPTGEPGSEKETSSTSIAGACLNYCRLETMLHITCAQYDESHCIKHLQRAKSLGLRNILALRGDLNEDEEAINESVKNKQGMKYAADLVRLIRKEFGDYFVVCVAGYPTGHPDSTSYEDDLIRLKEKVDAGADFIITQLFFREEQYFKYVQDCRALGITIPIIPGMMPIQSYDSLRHIVKLSKLEVPQFIFDAVEPIKQNDEAIRNYGIWLAVQMGRNLLKSGMAPGLHFYTLNREVATREVLQQLGLWQLQNLRILPWKPHTSHHKRCREDVRPIFWSARPKSYLYRTKDWDDFPNGRWGNSSSPAYGDLKDYYMFYLKERPPKQQLLNMWGDELNDESDVWSIFTCFVKGSTNKNKVKVTRLPWTEEDMSSETTLVQEQLAWCNENGILTINSQPNVNGAPSTDPVVGWGSPGGYVYQKAYLEFFTSLSNVNALKLVLPKYPAVSFHIINHDGTIDLNNSDWNTPIAVTWGVFPGCEISQPTVVDPISFHVWKDEAFDAWLTQWARLYSDETKSRRVLQDIHDNYCLVTLVDNEYPKSSCLWSLLAEMLEIQAKGLQNNNVALCDEFDRKAKCQVNKREARKALMNINDLNHNDQVQKTVNGSQNISFTLG